MSTTVFDASGAMAGSDAGTGPPANGRTVFLAAALSSGQGNQVRLTYLCGASSGSGVTLGPIYFGKAGGTEPDFNSNQVQMIWSGSTTFTSGPAKVIVSDWVSLK